MRQDSVLLCDSRRALRLRDRKQGRENAFILILLFSSVVFVSSCRKSNPVETTSPVKYSMEVQPLFNQKCATSGCHAGANPAEDLNLTSWDALLRGSHHGAMVIPFRAEKSHLIWHVNHDTTIAPVAAPHMPPGGHLPHAEVDLLMRWINEGARNDNGDVPYSNPKQGRVYVTCQADDEIAVIDIETNLLVRMIAVGTMDNRISPPEAPHNVVVDPQKQFYYVNLLVGNEIWKFRVSDDEYVTRLLLGEKAAPAQIVINAGGNLGYVSNFDLTGQRRSVQRFNTSSMQVTETTSDQRIYASHGVQLMHNGTELWSANQLSDNLAVINPSTMEMVDIVKVDPSVPDLPTGAPQFGPYQLVFSPDDSYAYVTCRTSNEVRVFNTGTRALVKAIPVGSTPLILDITPNGDFLYIANRGSGSVSVVRTSDLIELTRIDSVGVEPHGVAITEDGRFAYVSLENLSAPDAPHHPVQGSKIPGYVAVIDIATNQVVKRIEVGAFAAGVAIAQ
jgi:YVTN family beta-propeller protein